MSLKLKFNLNVKFFLYIFGMFLFLFFILGNLYFKQSKEHLMDKLLSQSKQIVRLSNLVIVNDIKNYNDIALLNFIEKIESVDNILYAIILAADGTVLSHSDVYEIGALYTDSLSKWAINIGKFSYKDYFDNGKKIIVCASPLVDAKVGTVAYIRLGISRSDIDSKLEEYKKNFLVVVIVFIAFFLIFFFIIFYLELLKPITLMRDGVDLMTKNLSKFKFNIKKQDEVAGLFSNINSLVANIEGVLDKLNLEEKVIQTSEQKRIENLVEILNKDSDVIIADSNNKVIFYHNNLNLFGKETLDEKHIMDVFKDSDISGMVADAYSSKEKVLNTKIFIDEKQYVVTVFIINKVTPFKNKTTILVRPFIDKLKRSKNKK
ncbi:MAG: hypothetical protein GY817_03505 [bacterium]|nr:hypothetical protein [bacterium]